MKTLQLTLAAFIFASLALTSGCVVRQERVYEPSGARVYHHEHRVYSSPSDYRDGYYDERGYWHPYGRR